MPENQFRAQRSPSPKASPKALPPLSKFFYGPAPGRGSAEASPASYNVSTWSVNSPHEHASSQPVRHSPDPPPYSPTSWAKNFPSHSDPAQGWDDHIPSPLAPPPGQFLDSYALMHKTSHSPVNPTWDSNSPRTSMDASRWSVNYQSVPMEIPKPTPPAKPPLPPRVSQTQGQGQRRSSENARPSDNHPQSVYSSKHPPSSRVSATTIDVPLFLQPYTFDSENTPPLPRRQSNPQLEDHQSSAGPTNSVPQPQRLPPPPPKIPLDQNNAAEINTPLPQRPQYDPQNSLEGSLSHTHSPRRGQHQTTFNRQDSHETQTKYSEWQQGQSLQPKIPTPQFSSFNEECALPPPSSSQQSDTGPQKRFSSSIGQHQSKVDDRFRAGSRLHQPSIFPNDNIDNDRWVSNNRHDPQTTNVPSPEPQHATLAPRDGSITTTDGSSNRAGLSTPESQQTSNTSNNESLTQAENNRQGQQNNETFYWHSGRSDSDAEEDYGQGDSTTATPGLSSVGKGSSIATTSSNIPQASVPLPPRSTSKVTTPNAVPYSASALGIGGPSDWEYFGDYEAEEVDDEELYTRSKHPAELPVESTATSKLNSVKGKENEEDDFQPAFEIDPPPVPDRSPAREDAPAFSSRDDTLQGAKHGNGDYSSMRLRMSSLQSPTRLNNSWNQDDRPISYYQRPDLDDVIRAWSEAPYIGVEGKNDVTSHTKVEDDEVEVDRVPEASLASTPQDKFLGIDLILKDAPEMPKLPDSIDQSSPSFPSPSFSQHKFERVASSENLKNDALTKPSSELKMRPSKQQEHKVESNVRGDEIKLASEPESTKESISRVDDRSTPISSPSTEFKRKSRADVAGESDKGKEKKPPAAERGTGTRSSDKGEMPSQAAAIARPSKESLAPTRENSTIGSSPTAPHLQSTSSTHEGEEGLVRIEGQQNAANLSMAKASGPLHNANRESFKALSKLSPTERPLNLHKSSKENIRLASGHLPTNDPATEVSRRPSKDSFQDAASTLSSDPPSREELYQTPDQTNVSHKLPQAASQGSSIATNQKENHTCNHDKSSPTEATRKVISRTPAPIKVTAIHPDDKPLQQETSKSANLAERTSVSSRPTSPKSPHSPKAVKVIDPYADLDPWGKASLNRFAAMLREEARAESNRDKLNIFNVFTSRESRLRVVLYGTDEELILPSDPSEAEETSQDSSQIVADKKVDLPGQQSHSDKQGNMEQKNVAQISANQQSDKLEPEDQNAIEKKLPPQKERDEKPIAGGKPPVPQNQKKKSFVQQAIERANSAGTLKALPALPSNRDSVVGRPPGKLVSPVDKDSAKLKQQQPTPEVNTKAPTDSPSDDIQYSPGGRPVIPKLPQSLPKDDDTPVLNKENRKSKMIDGNSIEPENPSTSSEVRPRPRPKPKDGESEVNNYLTNRRSVYRPFASQTLETMESGTNFGRQPDIKIDSSPIPLLRAPSSKFNAGAQGNQKVEDLPEVVSDHLPEVPTLPEQPEKQRFVQADFDPLLMILPEGEAKVCDSNRLQDLKDIMEAIPEDFSFIHASVVAWDAKNRSQREANDIARHERQAESEKRIDSLFDDHEIGYGDISELEAEFKRSEAARKADEDRNEYQTFVSDVFDVVWTRLHYELDQLTPFYQRYSVIMDSTFAGKDMFNETDDALALATTMSQFLALHQKIEIRHQKAFEAVLERDRRLKKTEISPWYSLNNIPKVKQLEKQFEDAEKKAIIEYCEQRDDRANQLMDVLDQNTLRGVGANQDYMEAIMKAVRRIASGRANESVPGSEEESDAGLEEVRKAQKVTALLATSSEQIVQTFHVADMLLNSADYEVSVAKAKVARVDMATLAKLKEERAKEDQKLMRDLEHRLALIREDSRRTNDEIIKLMLFLGVNNERAVEGVPRALGVHMRGGSLEAGAALDMQAGPVNDPEHQARMRKALDEAKRRNAKKDSV